MCCGTVDNENYYSNGKRRFDNPAMTCFRCTLGVFNLLGNFPFFGYVKFVVFLTGAGLIAISFVLFDFKLQSQLFKDILGPAVKLPYRNFITKFY